MNHVPIHFEIPADDPEKLVKFYTELFGWTTQAMPMGPDDTYWLITTAPEGEGIGGGLMKRERPGQVPMNYILVESVDEYAAKAKALGAQIGVPKTEIPGMGWFAVIVDPQGNALGLFENMPGAG